MLIKRGMACGTCSVCGRRICQPRPVAIATCDCWKTCPICGATMTPYAPDMTLATYIESGEMDNIMKCFTCGYTSEQQPVEVILS